MEEILERIQENPYYYSRDIERLSPEQQQIIKEERDRLFIPIEQERKCREMRKEELTEMRKNPSEEQKLINPVQFLKNLFQNLNNPGVSILVRYTDNIFDVSHARYQNRNLIPLVSHKKWKNLYILKNNRKFELYFVDPKDYPNKYNRTIDAAVPYNPFGQYKFPTRGSGIGDDSRINREYMFNNENISPLIINYDRRNFYPNEPDGTYGWFGQEPFKEGHVKPFPVVKVKGVNEIVRFLRNKVILEINLAEKRPRDSFIRSKVIFSCLSKDCYSFTHLVSGIQRAYRTHKREELDKYQRRVNILRSADVTLPKDVAENIVRRVYPHKNFQKTNFGIIPKKIKLVAKKLKIKLTIRRGNKRINKSLKVLKRQIKLKINKRI